MSQQKTWKTPKGTELPIMILKGKDYLQVAHRLVWFREDHPDWLLEVTYTNLNDELAMARAAITDGEGKLRAVAHKVEHAAHFGDYVEKAETGAIGRALALIGYGTQFAPDIDEEDRIVDSPTVPAKFEKPAVANPFDKEKLKEDPGTYVAKVGKFKGKSLKEIKPAELKNYVEWIRKNNQNMNPVWKEMVELSEAYLSSHSEQEAS